MGKMKSIYIIIILIISGGSLSAQIDDEFANINNNISLGNYLTAMNEAESLFQKLRKGNILNDSLIFEAESIFCKTLILNNEYEKSFELSENILNLANKLHTDTSFAYSEALQFKMISYLLKGNIDKFKQIFEQFSSVIEKHFNLTADYSGDGQFYTYHARMLNPTWFFEILDKVNEMDIYYNTYAGYIKKKFGDDDWDYAWILMAWATFYGELGLHEEALNLNMIAEKISLKERYSKASQQYTPFNNLMINYYSLKKYDLVEEYLLKLDSLLISTSYTEKGHTYMNLAVNKYKKGDYSSAQNYFLRSESILNITIDNGKKPSQSIVEEIQSLNVPYTYLADNYFYRGSMLLDMNNIDEAEAMFLKSMFINKNLNSQNYKTKLKKSFLKLGIINKLKGNFTTADNYFNMNLDLNDYLYKNVLLSLSENEKQKYFNLLINDYDYYYNYIVDRAEKSSNVLGDALNTRINTKGMLYYSSKKVKEKIATIKDENLEKEITDYKIISDKLGNTITNDKNAEISSSNSALQKQKSNIEKIINSRLNLKNDEIFTSNKDWKQIQKSLKSDEAAIEIIKIRKFGKFNNSYNSSVQNYTLSDSLVTYIAFIITKECGNVPYFVVLDDQNKFDNSVYKEYSSAINPKNISSKSFDEINNETQRKLKKVYSALWEPLEKYLAGKSKIFLSQDGIYHKINLNQLVNKNNKYLLDIYNISILFSTKDLISANYDGDQLQKENNVLNKQPNSACLIGCPDYNLGQIIDTNILQELEENTGRTEIASKRGYKEHWDPLPRTKQEVDNINKSLTSKNWDITTATDGRASESFIKKLKSPSILHIATHGFFNNQNINDSLKNNSSLSTTNIFMNSGLVLAGANYFSDIRKKYKNAELLMEDGILTAYEAANLNLDNTQLVVLSACETGLGVVMNGEGVLGLQRAFQISGARQIVMSLWKVDDEVTKKLMELFYKEYLQSNDATISLKRAQQKLKKEKQFSNPATWGAFVVFGIR